MKCLKLAVLVGLFCLIYSCTPYVITSPLKTPFTADETCAIGEIKDELPLDMDLEKKPTLEEVSMLRAEIDRQLYSEGIITMIENIGDASYMVEGGILEFKRGSGVTRFFIGFGIGDAKLTVALRLLNRTDNTVAFAANFKAQVSDWATKSDQIYKTVAANFAKALKKELKRLDKEAKSKSS
jgi:hypothetical protein